MISPRGRCEFVLPAHKLMAELAHIDASRSFEDLIEPATEA